jgi:hypothetical protein
MKSHTIKTATKIKYLSVFANLGCLVTWDVLWFDFSAWISFCAAGPFQFGSFYDGSFCNESLITAHFVMGCFMMGHFVVHSVNSNGLCRHHDRRLMN